MTRKELFPSHGDIRRDSEQLSDDTWMRIISLSMSRSAKITSHWLMSTMTQSIASQRLSGRKQRYFLVRILHALLGSQRLNFSWSITSDSETGSPLVLWETTSEYSPFFPLVWRALKSAWNKKDVLSLFDDSIWHLRLKILNWIISMLANWQANGAEC